MLTQLLSQHDPSLVSMPKVKFIAKARVRAPCHALDNGGMGSLGEPQLPPMTSTKRFSTMISNELAIGRNNCRHMPEYSMLDEFHPELPFTLEIL